MAEWINQVNDISKYQGFCYEITNKKNGRKYIGKKFYWFKKKGKKVESDWKTYYGSSNELLLDIKKYGKRHFTRKILHHCKSRAGCAYMELKEQVLRDALLDNKYYNAYIRVRIPKFRRENL